MKRLKAWAWWLRTWARTFKERPEAEVDQLAATRAILAQEIDAAADGTTVFEGDALSFAADFERQAALELIAFVKKRRGSICHDFTVADVAEWDDEARAVFWESEDQFDPMALDPAIGGLRSMAEAMRLEATR